MIDRDQIAKSIALLRHFIDNSFALSLQTNQLTGFELLEPLLDAAAYNTYLETVGNKTDTIYAHAKRSMSEMTTHSYRDAIKRISSRFDWGSKDVMLALDYTDEDFYGDVQGLDIYGWTGENAVTGKFKFLTCCLISDDIPEKIPLISIPVSVGHDMTHAVIYCIKMIEPYISKIKILLFDRGFYAKELMYNLEKLDIPFLILARKQKKDNFLKQELIQMQKGERKIIIHEYEFNTNKTNTKFETNLALLKSIFNKKLGKDLDWVFATNIEKINLDTIISEYIKRWRIEIQFRIQDEATIRCKSKDMKIRYFLFVFEELLQAQWACFYKKEEVSFKEFVIEMHKVNKDLVAHPRKSYGKA